jgi:hypothetical protein
MMTLREQQSLFMKLLPRLIDWAYGNGYELTGKELLRTAAQAMANAKSGAGIVHSLHLLGLAIDMALFKDGDLLTDVADFRPLGEYWKTLSPLACWGGDFSKPDADHFSLTWGGVK